MAARTQCDGCGTQTDAEQPAFRTLPAEGWSTVTIDHATGRKELDACPECTAKVMAIFDIQAEGASADQGSFLTGQRHEGGI